MITIYYEGGRLYDREFQFQCGDDLSSVSLEKIVKLEASGPELEIIRNKLRNIPDAFDSQSVIWTGDIAIFIINNLKLDK